jgi:hypothetical protein
MFTYIAKMLILLILALTIDAVAVDIDLRFASPTNFYAKNISESDLFNIKVSSHLVLTKLAGLIQVIPLPHSLPILILAN